MAIRMTGMVSGLDTDAIVKELMSAQSMKKTKIENSVTKTEWKKEKWAELNKKIYSLYTGTLSKMRLQSNYKTKKASSSNETKAVVTAGANAVEGNHKIKIDQVASSQYLTSAKLGKYTDSEGALQKVSSATKLTELGMTAGSIITITAGDKITDITVTDDMTVSDFTGKCGEAGISVNFDKEQQRFFLSSKASGAENAFSITSTNGALGKIGLADVSATVNADGTVSYTGTDALEAAGGAFVGAADSIIEYNGAKLTSSSTIVSANGLSIEVKGETATNETIDITVSKDVDSVYNMVKDFIKEYNELLKEMNEDYNAASAKDYDVLSDEEKEAMTEDQVEKWENKIKDSLLRRDSTLSGLLSVMKNSLQGSVEVDGKKYSLASFGIGTFDYTEKGLLHIDGNPDDEKTSGDPDKLRKALEEDPDAVMEVISSLAQGLYDNLTDKMKKTSLSSALTFYNDKQIDNELTEYKERIEILEDRLQEMEDRYYKQFAAMEKAMSSYNSISSLFGTPTQ